jgi:hypothetical protein
MSSSIPACSPGVVVVAVGLAGSSELVADIAALFVQVRDQRRNGDELAEQVVYPCLDQLGD